VTKEDINYVNAHATSTQMGDLKEFEALVRCFGQNPQAYLLIQKSSLFFFGYVNKLTNDVHFVHAA
jgi:3-oxoacyl-(acyl-carrier-protein) synthase